MRILKTDGKCPYCGKEITGYQKGQSIFGSPIVECKKCGEKYLDDRYHEIAVEGIGNVLMPERYGKIALIGLILFAVSALLNIYFFIQGKYNLEFIIVLLFSILIMVFDLVQTIRIKTGSAAKSIEKQRKESEERLKDVRYAQTLADLGYNVPEKYLYFTPADPEFR